MNRILAGGGAAALLIMLSACGGGGSSSPGVDSASVNVTGTWRGPVVSSVAGSSTATLTLNQTGTTVSGTYATTGGQAGSVVGTVSGATLAFNITPTQAGCTGALSGTGNVTNTTAMAFGYSGTTSCGGAETGTGNLVKQ